MSWLSMHNFPHGLVSFSDGFNVDPLRSISWLLLFWNTVASSIQWSEHTIIRHKTEFLRGLQQDHQVLWQNHWNADDYLQNICDINAQINGLFSPGCAHRWLRVKQGHLGLLQVETESPPFPSVHLDSRVYIVMDHESWFVMQNSNSAFLM